MKDYTYNIRIAALLEKEATEKMNALVILAAGLTAKELSALARVVKHEPLKLAMAKKYLGV